MMPAALRFIVGPVRPSYPRLLIEVGPVNERGDPPHVPNPQRRAKIANRGGPVAAFKLQDNQQVELSVTAVDAAGNPTEIEGSLSWASSDESVVTVSSSGDGTSATAVTTGTLGTAQIQVTDAESDGTNIAGTLDVEVVAGPATEVTISPGEPSERS